MKILTTMIAMILLSGCAVAPIDGEEQPRDYVGLWVALGAVAIAAVIVASSGDDAPAGQQCDSFIVIRADGSSDNVTRCN